MSQNTELVERFVAAWKRLSLDEIMSFFSDDAVYTNIPMEPPNVAGWPGGASWLNSSTMFARLNFLNTLGASAGQTRPAAPAPVMPKFATAAEAFDYYAGFLLDANLPDTARQAVLEYAGGPAAALSPDTQRDLIYLLLAMPQYHLS